MDTIDIVRHVLRVQGKRVVNTLANPSGDVQQIMSALEDANQDFQTRGWWFNTEWKLKLLPDANSGEVIVPANTVKFQITNGQLQWQDTKYKSRYVLRGTKIYDAQDHTYQINKSLDVDVVIVLPVEELPSSAANYLKHSLAKDFYVADDGDEQKIMRLEEKRRFAWQQLQSDEISSIGANALQSPQATALRYRIGQYGSPSNPYFPGGMYR